ncbi:5-formyltetrahydrofolate cyclo-ligase [Reyranella sp.]|uniref:5-formyltetrahydrofolate cyclo-ligase n=1 Tax=Reyranella sp. TaxID=1929291 RepID=UPI0011F484C8|nr:5-formyltetrahydrofolate cyclo-ligase [Reyranella sp.]TAJ84802.1 MAG: 5-formyltetrahydrofolate cyclo-ligase [Reyranella sp.]
MTLIDAKRTLRSAMLAWRRSLDDAARAAAAQRLIATMRAEKPFEIPSVVSGFWPIKDEIDIKPLMAELHGGGCTIALPVVQGRGQRLLFRVWRPGDALEAGVFGTLQPSTQCEVIEPDALLVPLLACDREGWRLGYGGGFYDRTLEVLRQRRNVMAIGVGFDGQFVPEVPHEPGDQRLDWLLTDRRASAFV